MKERFKCPITVGVILINDDNEILFQKRSNTGYMDGMYALVSGHLEKNESMTSAIVREVKEEVNLDIMESNVSFACIIRKKNDDYINSYFKCNTFSGEIVNNELNKCSELKWFSIESLPDNIIPNDKRAINNMINHVVLDEYDFEL